MSARCAARVALAGAALATACSPPVQTDAGTDAGPATFAQVQAIFTRSCAVGTLSCHAAAGRQAGLDLSDGAAYMATVSQPSTEVRTMPPMPIVDPGNPNNSYLFLKLSNAFMMVPYCMTNPIDCGARMPMVGGSPLSPDEVSLVRRWIEGGAMR